jgi:DNA-binding protein HU-beta
MNKTDLVNAVAATGLSKKDADAAVKAVFDSITEALKNGEKVVIFGFKPFKAYPTSFRLALAGRTHGLLSTVIADHPIFRDLPHEGFCSWQFSELLTGGKSIVLEGGKKNDLPIVEIIPTHKNHVNQGSLFEYNALGGKLLVCSFNFKDSDPAAAWLKNEIVKYALSEEFEPKNTIDGDDLHALINRDEITVVANPNAAFNPNDKTAVRKKK